jgi:hypothetical protein
MRLKVRLQSRNAFEMQHVSTPVTMSFQGVLMTFVGALRLAIAALLLAVTAAEVNAGASIPEPNAETDRDALDTDASTGEEAEAESIPAPAPGPPPGPPMSLSTLSGRWVGEGRLGIKDNPPESVKCRATYFLEGGETAFKQNIRCATAGGAIEVKSEIANNAGALTGAWSETIHNLSGTLTGDVKPNGLRIVVKGDGLHANMDIIVQSNKQIVEIQFFDSTLIGLTLVLTKG